LEAKFLEICLNIYNVHHLTPKFYLKWILTSNLD
jgi:hypothetical protein